MITSCPCVMVLHVLTILHTTEGCFVHPCAQAALFLDRRERGNGCREKNCRVLDHPKEEECVSGHADQTSLLNAAQENSHSVILSTHCAEVKSNLKRILMPY